MPPVNLKDEVNDLIKSNRVMVFSKSWCPYCKQVKELFTSLKIEHKVLELDLIDNENNMFSALLEISGQKTVPNVYINGNHVGGANDTLKAHSENRLFAMINDVPSEYEYDLIVIGGGSGGLAASKKAADLGKKVLLCDFVKPSPIGTSWGLGGTCVNVGCIPKKLMHQGSLLGKSLEDSKKFGWQQPEEKVKHDWGTMVQNVQDYIGSLNWNYRVALRTKKVKYLNAYAEFVDAHTIKATNKRGVETIATADKIIIAVGERPRYPDIPNAKEYSITSDDIFSLPYSPGKTLVVGASYVALECACFLKGLGYDVTIMVRSIFLRGFDQDIAERIGSYIEDVDGIKILRKFVPVSIEKITDGQPGTYKVTGKSTESDATFTDEYNTILFAIGRESCTKTIGLDKVGVTVHKNGKIPVNDVEQTNISNIYCIGDNVAGRLELTPVAILSGELLAKRLYMNSDLKMNYEFIPTTVFTSLEYSCSGLSEEKAIEEYGEDNIDVYHSSFWPLEWTVPGHSNTRCYAKVIVDKNANERILGMHYLGPNAGEVMQGFAAALNLGMTKQQLDLTVGIHPTTAEVLTSLIVTKRSGEDFAVSGC